MVNKFIDSLLVKSVKCITVVFCLPVLLIAYSAHIFAVTFSAGIEQSQWYLSSSIFECSLTHNIPHYGRATFYREAGESLKFFLNAPRNPMRKGKAALVIEAPKWRPGSAVRDLGFIAVVGPARPVTVETERATQMMDSLLAGMMPTVTRRARFNDDTVRVEVSSVNFTSFYEDYLNCVASLLPVNFRQMERSRVFFKVDEAELSADDKVVLDNVILYGNADPSVTAIYIDGHTDVTGRRIYNHRLSKARSEVVSDYLERNGLPGEMLTTRYHGESYPVVKARSKKGHAQNRRTTIRLLRGEKPAQEEEDADIDLDGEER